jgi:hypothetical protein
LPGKLTVGLTTRRPRSRKRTEVERVARRAVELGKNDAIALCWSANAISHFLHEHDAASALVDLSLSLNPNLAGA